jgi:hypothetical protein
VTRLEKLKITAFSKFIFKGNIIEIFLLLKPLSEATKGQDNFDMDSYFCSHDLS